MPSDLRSSFRYCSKRTIGYMVLALFAMRCLEIVFFLGVAGSSVVVLLSFIEDIRELFGDDEPAHGAVSETH